MFPNEDKDPKRPHLLIVCEKCKGSVFWAYESVDDYAIMIVCAECGKELCVFDG